MSPRRTFLRIVPLVLAGGCLGGPTSGSDADSDSTTSSADGVIPADCDPVRPDPVDPVRESVEPATYPDAPETRSREAVSAWVKRFEAAYLRNDHLSRDTRGFSASATVESVTRTDAGVRVAVESRWHASVAEVRSESATATATVLHADSPVYAVSYLLTERGALRAASDTGGEPPDPTDGDVVACFDGN